ncbi:hypothetical protein C2G38_2222721 [Gigaspora rosea]|uniref:MULE transposase domain-containing protein n=1 Tax=Gigaspora rosea TaxID=44941 RepID=A0A397U271_9GLOM|nr:hypothetical protein C2G38_2235045 [Gigaspora rosea]RIB04304.1 hypothetical protein C2G38_2222721 [Gigaspora rosea]
MFEDNIVFDKFMEYGPNENPMEYELVGAASEGEEIEDRDEPVESVHLEDELVEYEPVGTSQSSRNFENIDESKLKYHRSQLTASGDRMAKKRTYACENAGKYKPNKTRPLEHQRFRGSKKTDCKWHVNLSHSEINNSVHITFIDLEYNHVINVDNARFATAFRKFDESIMSEIERTIVFGHCDAYMIRNLLQPLFPNQLFLIQDLSNAIQKIKREKQVVGSDASHLLKLLLQQQKEDPVMFVQPLINADSNRLSGIFWMTSSQIMLWSRYYDVVLHDNTSRTNKYNFPLSLFILVDNDGKSRLGAQAFLSDETQESYEWVLQQTLDTTNTEP